MIVSLGPGNRPAQYDVTVAGTTYEDVVVRDGEPAIVNHFIDPNDDIPGAGEAPGGENEESSESADNETPGSDSGSSDSNDDSTPSKLSPIDIIIKFLQRIFSLFA